MKPDKTAGPSNYLVVGLIAVFSLMYLLYYPDLFSNGDENKYIQQALAFSEGKATLEYLDLSTWKTFDEVPSTVPPGTALLLTPLLMLGGWKTLFLLPFISHLAVTLCIVLILRHERLNPLFAAAYLFYPIAIIMSRLVMTDMVNLMFVTASICIFWTRNHRPPALLWAGLLAGLSILIRPTNVVFFIPFFSFHILRRRPGWAHLVLGVIAGSIIRIAVYGIVFGDPLYLSEGAPLGTNSFGFERLLPHLVFYSVTLTAGLYGLPLALIFYRGPFRAEILFSTLAMLLLYSSLTEGPEVSALYKSVVITNRYLLPVAPLLVVAAAWVISDKSKEWTASYGRAAAAAGLLVVVVLGAAAFHVHHAFLKERARLRDAIYNETAEGSVVIHDVATAKYFYPFWGKRHNYNWVKLNGSDILSAIEHKTPIYTVFLFRADRKWHNQCSSEFKSSLESVCITEPIAKVEINGETLEINSIESCSGPLPPYKNDDCLRGAPSTPMRIAGIL